jgi:flagellar assembly protein FliH
MTHEQPPKRIPAEEMKAYKAWKIPLIDDNGRVLSSAEKEAKERRAAQLKRDKETIEDVNLPLTARAGMSAQEMQKIFDDAEKDGFAQGHKEGLEKGRAEGYEAGQQQGLMEMRQQLVAEQMRFQKLAQALLNPMQEQDGDIEKMLLDIICTLTESVVQREIITDSSQIVSLVKTAVAALPVGSKNLRVCLNPDDLAAVESYAEEQQLEWTFRGDVSLEPGGCRVETAESRVDFSVAQRLQTVLEQFVNKQFGNGEDGEENDEEIDYSLTASPPGKSDE